MSRHSTASTSVAAATKFILVASQKSELVLQLFPLKKHDFHNIFKPLHKEIDSYSVNCLVQFCFHNSGFSVFIEVKLIEHRVFRKESERQVNFLAPENCFISYFQLDFYPVKLISGRLGPL